MINSDFRAACERAYDLGLQLEDLLERARLRSVPITVRRDAVSKALDLDRKMTPELEAYCDALFAVNLTLGKALDEQDV